MIEMLIEKFLDNLELGIAIIGIIILLFIVIICVIALARVIKSRKKFSEATEMLNVVGSVMQIAENFTNYSGSEKKEYVMTRMNQLAIENGIAFDAKAISDKIEELIQLSKEVNYNKTTEE